jgi:SAM-dependent methyltransferase
MCSTDVRDPQSFDHLSARYDRLATLLGAELHTWLQFHLPAQGGSAVDLGCGTGVWTELLADRYDEVEAVDLSAPMVGFARRHHPRPNVRYTVADLRAVEGRFDVVLSAYTCITCPSWSPPCIASAGWSGPATQCCSSTSPTTAARCHAAGCASRHCAPFRNDLLRRRRPGAEAVELLRLQLDPN